MEDGKTSRPGKLHTDSSYVNQPEGTSTYALNAVNETEDGDQGNRANEEGNAQCYQFPAGYIPIGKVGIGNGDEAIFLVSPEEGMSEIGIADRECNYTTQVNADLGFLVSHQIDATFRLRRGCERTLYFVTPKPMIFNLDSPEDYQDDGGNWDPDKFKLFKTSGKIPHFLSIEEFEGGTLPPGSYNFVVQYLDNDLNPTEFAASTETIKIYNDVLTKPYLEIRGSTNLETEYQRFGNTGKAIRVRMSNLDEDYPFYRVGVIEANNGSGQVSAVKYSQEIPTQIDSFVYTGNNFPTEGSEAEVLQFSDIIDSANHIVQIENTLILGETKGKQINYCRLQKYASRIKADMVTKTVILNALTEANPKTSTVDFYGTGYMPGEIYSFGIVYIFEDGTLSPVYHIPGKASSTLNMAFTPGGFPMSIDNECVSSLYTDLGSCEGEDYWGYDSEGQPLKNTNIRHHRFPLRSEANLPLLEEEALVDNELDLNQLTLVITGTPVDTEGTVELVVTYSVGGVESTFEGSFEIGAYDETSGLVLIITTSSETIVVLSIKENGVAVTEGVATSTGFIYNSEIGASTIEIGQRVYTSKMMGVLFSGIDLPSTEDTDGNRITGYYIVRNERIEDEKTILDSAVMTPLMKHEFFVAHGHLMPQLDNTDNLQPDALALIHPEFKFNNKEYKFPTAIIKEGEFRLRGARAISSTIYQDVMAGTSYDADVSKRRERDSDGFSLQLLTRDNELKYFKTSGTVYDNIEEIFYLDALTSRIMTDINDERKEIYNISADNKIGIIHFEDEFPLTNILTRLPYVILKRDLSEPYANFRVTPYYKSSVNPHNFEDTTESVSIFNGDAYVTPMRYFSSVHYDIRLRKRSSKKGILNVIVGVIAIAAGVVLAIYGGAALGGMLIAFGASQIASGIKKEQIAKVYGELYDAGLRETVKDDLTENVFGPNPVDDTVEWIGDVLTNLWFESSVNMALRQGATHNMTDFLNAPAPKATAGIYGTENIGFGTVFNYNREPQNELDSQLLSKLTVLDADNNDGRIYQGFPTAEIYQVNEDYKRRNKQKIYNHLALEYDCCSDCLESFPQRWHWSEQAFQEELSDNYRVFLPNNYRDLPGEKGKITNMYSMRDNLFIHTEEALWHLPNSRQERVTNQIVTYIGTGNFFDVPPIKMVDATESSAGTIHKWGVIKTKHGILFPSEEERKGYLFEGQGLNPITEADNSNWFKQNMPVIADREYYQMNGRNFPYANNPSNPLGTGYVSVYDSSKERFIVTKKDFLFNRENIPADSELCLGGTGVIIFNNYQETIDEYKDNGYRYEGLEGCRMKFSKVELSTRTETREVYTSVSSTADVHFFYDTSGSFDTPALTTIYDAAVAWFTQFQIDNPDFTGDAYHHQTNADNLGIGGLINQGGERWVTFPSFVAAAYPGGTDMSTKDIILISFCNESDSDYTSGDITNPIEGPTGAYNTDYAGAAALYNSFSSFIGIHYPIIFTDGTYAAQSRHLLQMILAALKGIPYTFVEAEDLEYNPGFDDAAWTLLKDSLQASNPFPEPGLENYGWNVKTSRYRKDDGTVITSEEFADDINQLLADIVVITEEEVEVQVADTIIEYVDGELIDIDDLILAVASWTMSYSLKERGWVSWHSYLPDFYFFQTERFYSWKNGNDHMWKHNIRGSYQTYYGVFYPFIIEYVSVDNPLLNKLWEYMIFQTEAKQYNTEYGTYNDKRYITFNKVLFYNTQQISGVLDIVVKDTKTPEINYMRQQLTNTSGTIVADRNERDWSINEFRNIRSDYDVPMFNKTLTELQDVYPIDKIVNQAAVDLDTNWYEKESFRDKFLVVRFIFDNFDNVRLITNFLIEFQNPSGR